MPQQVPHPLKPYQVLKYFHWPKQRSNRCRLDYTVFSTNQKKRAWMTLRHIPSFPGFHSFIRLMCHESEKWNTLPADIKEILNGIRTWLLLKDITTHASNWPDRKSVSGSYALKPDITYPWLRLLEETLRNSAAIGLVTQLGRVC